MTQKPVATVFMTTLNFPEILWLDFFRGFFKQEYLLSTKEGAPIPNRFKFDEDVPPSQRKFQIEPAYRFADGVDNALPALIIQDAAGAQQMGLTIDNRRIHSFGPEREDVRVDMIRFTYLFHCLSKDMGESRLLASIVTRAITSFKDQIEANGVNRMEPWSVTPSTPMRTDSEIDYVSTTVQVTFYTVERWETKQVPRGTMASLDLILIKDEDSKFINASWTVVDKTAAQFINASFSIVRPSIAQFITTSSQVVAPIGLSRFFVVGANISPPATSSSYIRTSAKIRQS